MSTETNNRREALQSLMKARSIDAFLITSPVHLYYMTETVFDGFYYVPAQGDGVQLVRRPVGYTGDNVVPFKSVRQLPGLLADAGFAPPTLLALEDEELSYAEYTDLTRLFASSEPTGGSIFLRTLRLIKSPHEIALLRAGATVHDAVHGHIPALYRAGMTDWDFSVAIEHQIRLMGHLGIMRCAGMRLETCSAIVLSGDSAQTPSPYDYSLPGGGRHPSVPIGSDGHIMQPGDTVNVDFCENINGYLTDITRTYAVDFIRPEAEKSHAVSLSILREMERTARPGTLCCDLYARAWEIADQAGYAHLFMGRTQQAKFIGHGIGLQVNEWPVLSKNDRTPLAPGMVIAIEPKLICPGVGPTGAENTYLVTEDGLEKLTNCTETLVVLR